VRIKRFSTALILAGTLLLAGCSEDDPAGERQTTVSDANTLTAVTLDSDQANAGAGNLAQGAAVEADVPEATAGSVEPQTAGELVDGLKLVDIRWGDHGTFYRIVFDLVNTGGSQVLQAPHAEATMSVDQTEIDLTLGGIRGIGEEPRLLSQEVQVGDALVLSINRVPSYDDQALIYRVKLSGPATYTLSSLGDPGRVIIDIYR